MAEGDVYADFEINTVRIVLPASGGARAPKAKAVADPAETTGTADPSETTGTAELPDATGRADLPDAEGEVTC